MDEIPEMLILVKAVVLFVLCLLTNRIEAIFCTIGQEPDPSSQFRHRWVIPVRDICQCSEIRVGALNTHKPLRPFNVTYLDSFLLSNDPVEIRKWLNCTVECLNPEPLGLEVGAIPDKRISASSSYHDRLASHGRLNNPHSYWGPEIEDNSWIEVNLEASTLVAGVITQGAPWAFWRVSEYRVAYQPQPSFSSGYEYVKDHGTVKVFHGNIRDASTPVTTLFPHVILATRVRVEPIEWYGGIAFRFEMLGCRLH